MTKKPANHRADWSKGDLNQLKQLAKKNTSTPQIAKELKRTEGAVRSKASEEKISLKPKDK